MKLYLCMCLIYPSLGGKGEPFLRIAWAGTRDEAERKFMNVLNMLRRDPYYATLSGIITHGKIVIEEAL